MTQTSPLRLLISQSNSAHFNLAVEECIFREMDPSQTVLFLWRNADVVVIGRGQNPWTECNTRLMEEDTVMLARRHSGGGAVYQDLGNSCFTFMAGKPSYDKEVSTKIVVNALNSLNIPAFAHGRNDIVLEKEDGLRKISGSAYRESLDRGFHHGTLLLNVNLNNLTKYLNPDPKKLEAKGITSVRSRVTNMNELYPDLTANQLDIALMEGFFDHYGERVEAEYISPEQMPNIPGFKQQYALQKSWDWNFGEVMKFTHQLDERFVWGGIDLLLDVNRGKITDAKLFSDSLVLEPFEALENALIGVRYRVEDIEPIFQNLLIQFPNSTTELTETKRWLLKAIQ